MTRFPKCFNKAGPCVPELNYLLPPDSRLPDARSLVEQGVYFVVHTQQPTGKTTALLSLARQLSGEGRWAAGESLRSVLRRFRDAAPSRPDAFPAAVALCGRHDIRDYKAAFGDDPTVASPRLGDFTEADLRTLYAQHTTETGQPFTEEALVRAWDYTAGQPWLVNALAAEVVDWMKVPVPEPVTAEHLDTAKERLILARATHLDSLVARLHEPRVRRIIEPLIAGDALTPDGPSTTMSPTSSTWG